MFVHAMYRKLAALREENERLKTELRCVCENDSRKLDEIKRLRANALIWHKWPDEKPSGDNDSMKCLIADKINGEGAHLMLSIPSLWNKEKSFYWAEIPRPEGE
jgi:hypothetical protein